MRELYIVVSSLSVIYHKQHLGTYASSLLENALNESMPYFISFNWLTAEIIFYRWSRDVELFP